jgi:hypothetical protein
LHNRIPASIILYIFNLFIVLGQNATQIHKNVSNKFKNAISYKKNSKILSNIRCCIADYMKNKYRNHIIDGDDPDTGKIVALDEALFLHDEHGNQIW